MQSVNITEIITFAIFFGAFVAITKVLSDNWTRRKMIDARMSADAIRDLWAWDHDSIRVGAQKWGFVLVTVGAALLVADNIPIKISQLTMAAIVMLATGAGLLIFHRFTTAKTSERAD